ncbi:MAG: hypothetical protein ABI868_19825 [Acidobacteriota bacterium]
MRIVTNGGPRAAAACLLALLVANAAAAQSGPPAPGGTSPGPMTVERVESRFLVAPEFKVTTFNHRTSQLVGAYAGWLSDRTIFLGGGGYWLADRSRNREMAYGGLVAGWYAGADQRIGFGVKGLIGGGRATLVSSFGDAFDYDNRDGRRLETGAPGFPLRAPPEINIRVREQFFVAEPEATMTIGFGRHFRVTAGAGYRLIGGARSIRNRLDGATGSVALQIGGR